jgi:predicted DNA-binding mobile mystery protein A
MNPYRSVIRQGLDRRLEGLALSIGPRPGRGWIREIREALGMSTFELAQRVGVTQSRASQYERAEVGGNILLSSLEKVATAMQCRLCYALVPEGPLQELVYRQALDKAAASVGQSGSRQARLVDEALHADDPSLAALEVFEQIEELAHELIDRRGLWKHGVS